MDYTVCITLHLATISIILFTFFNKLIMKKLFFLLPLALMLFATSCDDDEAAPDNAEEVITDLVYTLTPDNSGGGAAQTVVLSFNDPDGDGGTAPTVTVSGPFVSGTTYTGAIVLTNNTETPGEDITAEIAEEDDEHQFFFTGSSGLNLEVAYNDQDDDMNPIGLSTTVTAGAASTGDFTVILRHEPDKDAAGVKEGNIGNAGGETDIEVTFSVTIE